MIWSRNRVLMSLLSKAMSSMYFFSSFSKYSREGNPIHLCGPFSKIFTSLRVIFHGAMRTSQDASSVPLLICLMLDTSIISFPELLISCFKATLLRSNDVALVDVAININSSSELK